MPTWIFCPPIKIAPRTETGNSSGPPTATALWRGRPGRTPSPPPISCRTIYTASVPGSTEYDAAWHRKSSTSSTKPRVTSFRSTTGPPTSPGLAASATSARPAPAPSRDQFLPAEMMPVRRDVAVCVTGCPAARGRAGRGLRRAGPRPARHCPGRYQRPGRISRSLAGGERMAATGTGRKRPPGRARRPA